MNKSPNSSQRSGVKAAKRQQPPNRKLLALMEEVEEGLKRGRNWSGSGGSLPKFTHEKFWNKVIKQASCWIWCRSLNRDGYGVVYIKGKQILAHRLSWVISHGQEIKDGMTVDHLCRNRRCVNPEHMEIVTPSENGFRGNTPWGINSRKTCCKRGHQFTHKNKHGHRLCGICRRMLAKIKYQQRKQSQDGTQPKMVTERLCSI